MDMIVDDTVSRLFQYSDITSRQRSSRTSNPKPLDTFSEFGDVACGEPLYNQHVVIDFTPTDEDTDYIQKKVCSFWEFINNTPEIQNLKVKPEKRTVVKPSTTSGVTESVKSQPVENAVDMGATACSMLEAIEEKGLITRTFEAKLPQTYCSLGSRKSEEEEITQQKKTRRHVAPGSRTPGSGKKLPPLKAKILCKKLEEWDRKHPKCMCPPCHPPKLHHCDIQKQVFNS